MDQVATQAAPPKDRALNAFARLALVLSITGLAMCVIWALGMLSPWLPARIWLWIDFHGLEWWAFAIGTFGPVVAVAGAALAGVIALVARLSHVRARRALLAIVLSLVGITVFAAAWIGTSIWVPGV